MAPKRNIKLDKKVRRMYLVENKFGRKLYTYKEIAEIIGVSKVEVKRRLRNLPDWKEIRGNN